MDKKDLKELYEIYSQARSTNLFSKFLFNRKMNSREVKSVLEKMQVYFEIHGERLDEKDIAKMYMNLSKTIETQKIVETFTNKDLKIENAYSKSMQKIDEKVLEMLGRENLETRYISLNFLKIAFGEDKNILPELFEKYIPTLFKMHLRANQDYFLSDETLDIKSEHQSLEEFKELLQSNSEDGKKLRNIANIDFYSLIKKYSLEELNNSQEMIDNDVKLGLDRRFFDYGYPEVYKENKEAFRKLSQYIDENTLELIEHSNEYARQINTLINSGRYTGESLERLKENKALLSLADIANPEQLLENFKNIPDFGELISDAVQEYEVTYREDIVQNVMEVKAEKVQKIELLSAYNNQKIGEIDGIVINSLQELGIPLVHLFNENEEVYESSVTAYMSSKIIEKSIMDKNISDEELSDLIDKLYGVVKSEMTGKCPKDISSFEQTNVYKKVIDLVNDDYDKEFVKEQAERYLNTISDPAKISELNVLSQSAIDKINELVPPEKAELFTSGNNVPLCTMLMKIESKRNIQSKLGTMALVFDKNGIGAEDIILSSKDNLEINMHRDTTLNFDAIKNVNRSSASLETLKKEKGISATTNRTNGEIDLNRANIKPSGLMYFGSKTLNRSTVESLGKAVEKAQELGIPFVFVDVDEIEKDFDISKKHISKDEKFER